MELLVEGEWRVSEVMYIGRDALRQRFHASYVLDGEDEVVECGIADEGRDGAGRWMMRGRRR